MIRISNIKLKISYSDADLNKAIAKSLSRYKVGNKFKIIKIVKKSLDARDKSDLKYILSVDVELDETISSNDKLLDRIVNDNNIMLPKSDKYIFPHTISDFESTKKLRPVIIGAGPAGYFCALNLARAGFKPIVLERGKSVPERTKDVESFWNGTAPINKESNVSFGEGGAGTFSDGKLNTGIKDKMGRIGAVLEDFVKFGAPEEITYLAKPHIGTDCLKTVCVKMREEIESHGGEVRFNSRFTGYRILDDNNISVDIENQEPIITSVLVLALGHSSRDTFKILSKSLEMEPKDFAIGLRIEHPASLINEAQYGTSEDAKKLPTADYKFTYRTKEGRSVYSFCMCPGGFVVNASSDQGQSVVNGMSNSDRAEANSNSAVVCNVTVEDFKNEGFLDKGVLSGMYFQEKYEALAYEVGKGNIPMSTFGDYEAGNECQKIGDISPNLKGSYTLANLNKCLPEYVNNAIIEGIHATSKAIKNFDTKDAILLGIESRTSSPVRILRDSDTLMSDTAGIFPCGEGAGYAGGITSAAVDGIKVAEAVAKYLLSKD